MRYERDNPEPGVGDYSRWLADRHEHEVLASRVAAVFAASGPAMPAAMRRDLAEFLRERSALHLALCIAMNDDPCDDAEFLDDFAEDGR